MRRGAVPPHGQKTTEIVTAAQRNSARQSGLFDAPALPEGFCYSEEVLNAQEERRLLDRFALLPFKPFEFHQYLGNRRIVSFGFRYDYSERALRPSAPLPGCLKGLRETAAHFSGVEAAELRQVLVTEYAPNAGIGWHRDKPIFRDVIAFSFLAPCVLRFRRRSDADWERRKQILSPRSAYLLSGSARREWEHSIPPVRELRYSVTFRNFVEGDAARERR